MELVQLLLVIVIFVSACGLVSFSILSRRKETPTELQFSYRARMNISMGLCFLAWAGLQFTLPSSHVIRDILIILIVIIGAINLFVGWKRYRWITNQQHS